MDFFYSTVFCMIYLYALDYDCTDILNGPPANRVLEAIKYIMSDSFLRDSGLSHAPLLVEDINGMIIYQCMTNLINYALSYMLTFVKPSSRQCLRPRP